MSSLSTPRVYFLLTENGDTKNRQHAVQDMWGDYEIKRKCQPGVGEVHFHTRLAQVLKLNPQFEGDQTVAALEWVIIGQRPSHLSSIRSLDPSARIPEVWMVKQV